MEMRKTRRFLTRLPGSFPSSVSQFGKEPFVRNRHGQGTTPGPQPAVRWGSKKSEERPARRSFCEPAFRRNPPANFRSLKLFRDQSIGRRNFNRRVQAAIHGTLVRKE